MQGLGPARHTTGSIPDPSQRRSWWARYRWLLLRRAVQFTLLGLFMAGPLLGIWWAKGNLASSLWFDVIPLTDPLIALQSYLAVGAITTTAALGAGLVLVFYALVGGRAFCSWVCPVNVITDAAHWLRLRLPLPPGWRPQRQLRWWALFSVIVVATTTGTLAFELLNPVTLIYRACVFGAGSAWALVLCIFLFDLLVSRRGWCGHLCPVGAFYAGLGQLSWMRIRAGNRTACTDCGDCFEVCPEPHVITPALKGSGSTLIASGDCTNCGRCIDVCPDAVFQFGTRLAGGSEKREQRAQG